MKDDYDKIQDASKKFEPEIEVREEWDYYHNEPVLKVRIGNFILTFHLAFHGARFLWFIR